MFSRRLSKWAGLTALALAYFLIGKAGLLLAFLQPSATPVWPATGIAVAALLVLGPRAWPAIFVGALFVNLTTDGNGVTSFCIATGNTLEALCGAWLLNQYAGGRRVFERVQDVFKFALIGAVSTALSPSIGLTSLALSGFASWGNYGGIWFTWWLGDLTGYIVIAPLVLLWWAGPYTQWKPGQKTEAGALLLLIIVIGGTVFGGWLAQFIKSYPFAFLCGPIILWTAFRFGQLETATGVFVLTGIALWGTLHHYGPFQLGSATQSLLTLQAWAGVLTLTTMTLATAMAERRRAEAELEEQKAAVEAANQTKDNFLAMLSHELRTPLTPVLSFLDLLEMEDGKSESTRTAVATIRRNIEIEGRLIDDLLDLTRIAKGKLQLEFKAIDAHEAVSNVVDICRPDAAQKGLRLELDLRATESHIAADAAKFQQIIWNLLKNAIKFTPEKGEITISSRNEEGGELALVVRDSGIGIEPETIGRVFNPFEQGDQSFHQRHGGLGLGLAISKAIADGHGATLKATSDGRNQGATFRLTMKTVPPSEASSAPTVAADNGEQRPLRILLVDDHADTCTALEKLLTRRGHRVATARDVRSATERAHGDVFDLLISDVGLPDGTGAEVMSRLCTVRVMPGIAISGFGMNGDVQKSLKAGFSEHLVKPVSFEKLEAAITRAMKGRNGK